MAGTRKGGKRHLICLCVIFTLLLACLALFLSSGRIRRELTVRTFTRHRALFERVVELYQAGPLEQRRAFWWDVGDLPDECPEEIQTFLTETKFQGLRDWFGDILFYKEENGVVSFGILYHPGHGYVDRAPFNQLYHIDGPWYYYIMDGTMI